MMRAKWRTGLLMVATLVLAGTAVAQETARPRYSSLINVDALIENHTRFLVRKYNLSEEQEHFTTQYLHERADTFLSQYGDELWPLVDRLFEVRSGGEMDQQELMEWGQRVLPVYQRAKDVIVQGNEEWRSILNDEQRQIHDEDLALMYESFANTEEQLTQIVSGEMTVEEFRRGARNPGSVSRRPPRRPPPRREPPRQVNPPRPQVVDPNDSRKPSKQPTRKPHRATPRKAGKNAGPEFESEWEKYVREFIERYQLNEAQSTRANLILEDCQDQARRVMKTRKPALENIDKQLEKLAKSDSKNKAAELKKLNEQREKALAPIGEIFERQLKARLEKLPTRAQREAAEGSKNSKSRKTRRSTRKR